MVKGVSPSTASKWIRKAKEEGINNLKDRRSLNGKKGNARLENYVFAKFVERRTKGLPLNMNAIRMIALAAPSDMKIEGFQASNGWIQKFMKKHWIVRRKKTHSASKFIAALDKEMLNFFDQVQEIYSWEDPSLVFLNLDETAVHFDMSNDYTFHLKGEKEIKVISHASAKSRVSVMPCISNRGDALPPLFIGTYPYASQSDRTYPKKYEYYANQTIPFLLKFNANGTNNEDFLEEYIIKVIKPWKTEQKVNVVLVLDEASCHTTDKVKKAMIEANILPLIIPSGATSLLQPLDVELNKIIKNEIRKSYLSWLEKQAKLTSPSLIPPDLLDIIGWTNVSLSKLSKDQIAKSFSSTGLSDEITSPELRKSLHSKLGNLFDEYLERLGQDRELLDDHENLYEGIRDIELKAILEEDGLEIINQEDQSGSENQTNL